ncbi:hypothetical protein [Streptomyces sp. 4N124]|uniref:hypothetical protein n=1 Tax=Streptomyces sp. 4N124 TaxID=3457420 RepID=UPI003FCFF1E3
MLFSERGGILTYTAYYWVWREAAALALPPALSGTPAREAPVRPAPLGAVHVLCAGADPAEVAQRAGNRVQVLLSRYLKCLYDRQSINNQRIEGC